MLEPRKNAKLAGFVSKYDFRVGKFSTYQCIDKNGQKYNVDKIPIELKPAFQALKSLECTKIDEHKKPLLLSQTPDGKPLNPTKKIIISPFNGSAVRPLEITPERSKESLNSAEILINTEFFPPGLFGRFIRGELKIEFEGKIPIIYNGKRYWPQLLATQVCQVLKIDLIVDHKIENGLSYTVPKSGFINEKDSSIVLLSAPALNFFARLNAEQQGIADWVKSDIEYFLDQNNTLINIELRLAEIFDDAIKNQKHQILMPINALDNIGGGRDLYLRALDKVSLRYTTLKVEKIDPAFINLDHDQAAYQNKIANYLKSGVVSFPNITAQTKQNIETRLAQIFDHAVQNGIKPITIPINALDDIEGGRKLYVEALNSVRQRYPSLDVIYTPPVANLTGEEQQAYIEGFFQNIFDAAVKNKCTHLVMPAAGLGAFKGDPTAYFRALFKIAKQYPQLNIIYNPLQYSKLFQEKMWPEDPENIVMTDRDVIYLAEEMRKDGVRVALLNPSDVEVMYGIREPGQYWADGDILMGTHALEEDIGVKTTAPVFGGFYVNPRPYYNPIERNLSDPRQRANANQNPVFAQAPVSNWGVPQMASVLNNPYEATAEDTAFALGIDGELREIKNVYNTFDTSVCAEEKVMVEFNFHGSNSADKDQIFQLAQGLIPCEFLPAGGLSVIIGSDNNSNIFMAKLGEYSSRKSAPHAAVPVSVHTQPFGHTPPSQFATQQNRPAQRVGSPMTPAQQIAIERSRSAQAAQLNQSTPQQSLGASAHSIFSQPKSDLQQSRVGSLILVQPTPQQDITIKNIMKNLQNLHSNCAVSRVESYVNPTRYGFFLDDKNIGNIFSNIIFGYEIVSESNGAKKGCFPCENSSQYNMILTENQFTQLEMALGAALIFQDRLNKFALNFEQANLKNEIDMKEFFTKAKVILPSDNLSEYLLGISMLEKAYKRVKAVESPNKDKNIKALNNKLMETLNALLDKKPNGSVRSVLDKIITSSELAEEDGRLFGLGENAAIDRLKKYEREIFQKPGSSFVVKK